jgi:hypothetical protein
MRQNLKTCQLKVMLMWMGMTLPLFAPGLALAETRETQTMQHVADAVQPQDWVILDLDNTLMQPAQTLGSDQWFGYRIQVGLEQGLSLKDALAGALGPWWQIQFKTGVKPMESMTAGWIQEMQAKGITVMGLTARAVDLAATSHAQLASLGIDLARTPPVRESKTLEASDYQNGVLYLRDLGDKGAALMDFLVSTDSHPESVIFVDDKMSNVRSVEKVLEGTSIRHLSFRYGAADATVARFNSRLADIQYREFVEKGILISDEVGLALLEAAHE